ncbi:hypothetical protein IAG25_10840 [Caballeronia sp. EK]|uniref:hypothetical protein n=1 Tax=Caballeronia sp. EK TaxID=2767469 RepID=UPI001655CD32|nr:hypothetical protein [Caballeronia sp. EK]MBC8637308.1 hypothetical protein [Caballeronia sp. EK]
MNRSLFYALLLSLALIPIGVAAQATNQQSVMTGVPADARFEIVQSELAVRWTFKLDKFAGVVFQLVATKDGGVAWEEVPRLRGRTPDPATPNRVNYQIFLSGMVARNMLLLNVNSGATWQLQSGNDGISWVPFE